MPSAASLSQAPNSPRAGDTFASGCRTVTEPDIVAFARQTGDLHPLHLDDEWAAGTRFGERIAPGTLTLSYAIGLLRLNPDRAIALIGITDVVFTRPVKAGDTLSVAARVLSVSPSSPGTEIVVLSLSILNQDRKLVCRARAQLKWRSDRPC